jgi:hypothetical protein
MLGPVSCGGALGTRLIRSAFGVLSAFLVACDTPLLDLGEEISLSASVDERRRPLEIRDGFSLEDERIYVHVTIPPETAGPEQRDFHFEYFDGEGRIVSANGTQVTRTRPDWLVISSYRINPEIDAPGLWSLDVYVDGRHLERTSFPVTRTADEPRPPASPGRPRDCCKAPGPMAVQVYLSTGADPETFLLTGRRERFRLGDGKLNVYLRFTNIPDGTHDVRYDFYDGTGKPLWSYETSFRSRGRGRVAWSWRDFVPSTDVPGLWTVDIRLDGALIGSVPVPVDP